ncbi:lysophospholipid acyltransferase family protein [Methylobacterium sp. Leaf93]|uniref:lysophospholipid acyltransferase family protein n=1 Tax=Methylobacterium sp. Leaf93 TaxID=1736249 RepID=UPI0009E83224|nr:lysophospholipid acyltransferase family protein [Methylobacterium sp. Leaf93]
MPRSTTERDANSKIQEGSPVVSRTRSALFNVYWAAWTACFALPLVVLAALGCPTKPIRAATRLWSRGILFGLRHIVGLSYVEEGRAHIPTEPCLIVANHQSAWETLAFLVLVPNVAIVAKRELVAIPIVGWFLRRSPMIIIDRANGTQALRTMIDESRLAIAEGRSILMFPEGTRSTIDAPVQFKRGVELLYAKLGLPVLPVAVNSGLYWPHGGSRHVPGTVVVSYLAALKPGLSGGEFMRGTQDAIDAELNRWRSGAVMELQAS